MVSVAILPFFLAARDNLGVEPLPVLLLGCLAGLAASLSRLAGGRGRRGPRAAPAAHRGGEGERDLGALREGDVVEHGGATWVIRRALPLQSAGRWRALYELDGDGAPRRLLVSDAGGEDGEPVWLLAQHGEPRADLLVSTAAPATESLPHDGVRYRLLGRYHTAVGAVAATAVHVPESGEQSLSLLCYRGPGGRRLLVVRWRSEASARIYVGDAVLRQSVGVLLR